MAEEQRLQKGHRLCANNCGFFGSPAMNDLCSKCYRDLRHKEERASSAKIAVEKSLLPSSSLPAAEAAYPAIGSGDALKAVLPPAASASASEERGPAPQQPGRCTAVACRKRVGLVGFRCRCGATYCGAHRYPEQHGCTFDFKEVGREAIARANPVVKADKLDGRI